MRHGVDAIVSITDAGERSAKTVPGAESEVTQGAARGVGTARAAARMAPLDFVEG